MDGNWTHPGAIVADDYFPALAVHFKSLKSGILQGFFCSKADAQLEVHSFVHTPS